MEAHDPSVFSARPYRASPCVLNDAVESRGAAVGELRRVGAEHANGEIRQRKLRRKRLCWAREDLSARVSPS